MAEDRSANGLLEAYQAISEDDQKKANVFFERGQSVANSGSFDYAIEMYIQGLRVDPENTEAHQQLRDLSIKRKASGGKPIGMFKAMGFKKAKDEKEGLLNAETLLANDPGNTDHMLSVFEAAFKGGFYDTALWIGPILQKANTEGGKPDYNKYIKLKDIYRTLGVFDRAVEACQHALLLRPDDMDLSTELKNLGAQHTMSSGGYNKGKSFRDSIRDRSKQQDLIEGDRDVHSSDFLRQQIARTEAEWQGDPNETGKLMKYVEALTKTESLTDDARAFEVLDAAFERTKQFRFRAARGRIRLVQLAREERSRRQELQASPQDEELRTEYREFVHRRAEEEYEEFRIAAENYPTDTSFKYNMAVRLFQLERHQEAIPLFQQSRQDPKYRTDAAILLGRSFLANGGYNDEAIDTLRGVIDIYELRGDAKSKEMYYWYGVATEKQGDAATALKAFSQVAQWDFNYRDVQARVKRLRGADKPQQG